MYKSILVSLLFIISASALAGWSKLTEDEQGTVLYIDSTTIRRSENSATMWSMLDFKKSQVVSGARFKSGRTQFEYDCKGERSRTLSMSFHSANLGLGETVHMDSTPQQWGLVSPTSIGSEAFNYVCKTQMNSVKTARGSDMIRGWIKAQSSSKATVFYDPISIQRSKGMSRMWVLTNFTNPMLIDGKQHQSSKSRIEYDCSKERSRIDGTYFYALPDGKGETSGAEPASNDWYAVAPKSFASTLLNIACSK